MTGREGLTRNMEIRLTTLPMTWRLWSQRIDVRSSDVDGQSFSFLAAAAADKFPICLILLTSG